MLQRYWSKKMTQDEIREGIQDWQSIMDYEDKEQIAWCRRNITELRQKIFKMKKEKRSNN